MSSLIVRHGQFVHELTRLNDGNCCSDYFACLGSNLERPRKSVSADELCIICRNLNLRTESFIDLNWRHPSSFETRVSVRQENLDRIQLKSGEFLDNVTARILDIVTPPTLHDQVVYTDEFLGQFEGENTVDSSRREFSAPERTRRLGKFEDIVRRESCSLCSLFADIPKRFGFVIDNMQSVLGSYPCKLSFSWKENGGQSFSTLVSDDSIPRMGRNICTLDFAGLHFELLPVIDNGGASWVGGRAWTEQGVDAVQIQSWLQSCFQDHGELCNSPPWLGYLPQLPTLRMIDVEQGCLVKMQEQCPYVVLSYVWGRDLQFKCTNSLLPSLEIKFGLVRHWEQIPRTVQDTFKLVRLLGLRYLWVDSLCIVQDSQADMQDQFPKMGQIYGNALLTIVAADADDASIGLFNNINTASRVGRQIVRYSKDLSLLICPPNLNTVLRETRWATRGWTFQEALLSKRLLVFVDQTVYFSCRSTTWSEQRKAYSETVPPPWTWAEAPSPYVVKFEGPLKEWSRIESSLQIYYPNLQSWFVASMWQSLVNEYSTRILSHELDVLAAIAGVQEVFGRIFPQEILYGMPLSIIQTALLWNPRTSLRRRKDGKKNLLPSWTWTAWIGEVDWQYNLNFVRMDVGSGIDLPMTEDEALLQMAARESGSQASSLRCSTPQVLAEGIRFWLVDQVKKSRSEISRTSYQSAQFRDASWPHYDQKRSVSYHLVMALRHDFAAEYERQTHEHHYKLKHSVRKRGFNTSRNRNIPDERSNLNDCGTFVPDSWKLLCIRTQCRRFLVAPLESEALEGLNIITSFKHWHSFECSDASDCSEADDMRLYGVLDQQQVCCGAVLLSTQDFETLAVVDGYSLFIVISGPHYMAWLASEPDPFDRERFDRADADYFEVMMISMKGEFAERVGVGRIYADAWNWTDGKLEEYTLI